MILPYTHHNMNTTSLVAVGCGQLIIMYALTWLFDNRSKREDYYGKYLLVQSVFTIIVSTVCLAVGSLLLFVKSDYLVDTMVHMVLCSVVSSLVHIVFTLNKNSEHYWVGILVQVCKLFLLGGMGLLGYFYEIDQTLLMPYISIWWASYICYSYAMAYRGGSKFKLVALGIQGVWRLAVYVVILAQLGVGSRVTTCGLVLIDCFDIVYCLTHVSVHNYVDGEETVN